eukprot:Em0030g26a
MKKSTKPIKKSKKPIKKSKKPIKKSKKPIKKSDKSIAKSKQPIKKIEAFVNSNEYKAVAKHFAWGKPIPGTSEEDKALWCYFKSKVDHLNKTIEGLNQSKEDLKERIKDLHKQNAAAFKKLDITRKRMKQLSHYNDNCSLALLTFSAEAISFSYFIKKWAQHLVM